MSIYLYIYIYRYSICLYMTADRREKEPTVHKLQRAQIKRFFIISVGKHSNTREKTEQLSVACTTPPSQEKYIQSEWA